MPIVSARANDGFAHYPAYERADAEDGFRSYECAQEEQIGVEPRKIARRKVAYRSQGTSVNDEEDGGNPPSKPLLPRQANALAEVVGVYIDVGKYDDEQ